MWFQTIPHSTTQSPDAETLTFAPELDFASLAEDTLLALPDCLNLRRCLLFELEADEDLPR